MYSVLFIEQHETHFHFVDMLKTEYYQHPDLGFQRLSSERKRNLFFFFVQVNKRNGKHFIF